MDFYFSIFMYVVMHMCVCVCVYSHICKVSIYVRGDGGTRLIHLSVKARSLRQANNAQICVASLVSLLRDPLFLPFTAGTTGRLPCLFSTDVGPRGLDSGSHICTDVHSLLSHLSRSPHVHFSNRTEVEELSQTVHHREICCQGVELLCTCY